ncbi:hypothetical protein MASR2M29_02820 [Spirochaetota bacterium]
MKSEIIIYQTQDGLTKIDLRMEGETVWLTQADMVELFRSSKANISEHLKHIFEEGELFEDSVVRNFRTTAADNKTYNIKHYNLDAILAVGYRVKSPRGTQFRQWATTILHEYLQKGFTMNHELLKNMGGGIYWKELLERVRDIRASEKVMYRQVLDLYATSLTFPVLNQKCNRDFSISYTESRLHDLSNKPFAEKMVRFTGEFSEMFKRSHELEEEIGKRVGGIGYEI